MELPILWLILSIAFALYGANRNSKFWKLFFLSLVLSPVAGAIAGVCLDRRAAISARYVSKAEKLIRYNNIPEAISYLNPALYLRPDPEIAYQLAICYSLMKDKNMAAFYLGKAKSAGLKHPERTGTDPLLSTFRVRSEPTESVAPNIEDRKAKVREGSIPERFIPQQKRPKWTKNKTRFRPC